MRSNESVERFKGHMLCWATRKMVEPAIKDLIEGRADIAFHDGAGMSPLFYAAEEGDDKIVRLLIKAKRPAQHRRWKQWCNGARLRLRARLVEVRDDSA